MPARPVACPRCGYSLRGTPATWTDRCPLRGRCPECGLAIDWAEVLGSTFAPPRWFVEGPGPLLPAVARTLAATLRPWRFWREVRMTHPVRPWRWLAYVGLLAALLYVTAAVGHGVLAWRHHGGIASRRIDPSGPALLYAAHAAALPLSDRSIMTYGHPRQPQRLRRAMWSPRRLLGQYRGPGWLAATAALFPVAVWVVTPLAYGLVPISLRRARVRPAHVVRIAVYAAPLLLAILAWQIAHLVTHVPAGPFFLARGPRTVGPAGDAAIVGALVLWWGFATRRYLRMPRAWAVAVVLVGLATLVAAFARAFARLGLGLV